MSERPLTNPGTFSIVEARNFERHAKDIFVFYDDDRIRECVGGIRYHAPLLCWFFFIYQSNTRGLPAINTTATERYKTASEVHDAACAFMREHGWEQQT